MSRTLRKCGIQVQPPAFVIVYRQDEMLRKKVMPLRHFKSTSNVEFVAKEIKERHKLQEIPNVKVERLLSCRVAAEVSKVRSLFAPFRMAQNSNHRLLESARNRPMKALAAHLPSRPCRLISKCLFGSLEDNVQKFLPPLMRRVSASSDSNPRLLQLLLSGMDKSEAEKKIEKEFEIKTDEDLNKLSTHELELQKELMDSLFLKNQIKKGAEGYVYDKQVDFSGEKENSNWDSEPDFWD